MPQSTAGRNRLRLCNPAHFHISSNREKALSLVLTQFLTESRFTPFQEQLQGEDRMKIDANSLTSLLGRQPAGPNDRQDTANSFAAVLECNKPAATKRYDFADMTPKDLLETMNGLIRDGQMDLDETTALVGMIPSPLSRVDYDGTMPAAFDQPCDFFEKIEQGIAAATSRNDRQSVESLRRAADALARFQGQLAKAFPA